MIVLMIFYAEFGELPEYLDINGFRVIPFDDPGLPGFHAVRLEEEFERMKKAAAEFPGPVISLQHVPLIEADKNPCREHYTNANEIIASLQEINGAIAISGHAHAGINEPVASGNTYSIVVPGLCEKPHRYAIIDADTNLNVKVHIEQL